MARELHADPRPPQQPSACKQKTAWLHLTGIPQDAPPCLSRGQRFFGALTDPARLELSDAGHHPEHHPYSTGGGVDLREIVESMAQ
nr:hypothetical protein [Prochlorococcus marinus]